MRHGGNFWANKPACPRDHLLIEPNLMPSQLKRGHRSCLACARAHNNRDCEFNSAEFIELADRYYAEIMGAA